MAYAHTNLSIESNLDILDKYKQLIEATSDGESLYVRAREVIRALKDDNMITNGDEGTAIAQVVAQLAGSGMSSAISGALQWATSEKDIQFKKEELEYRIDQMKLEAQKTELDRDIAEANKTYAQAKTIREMGTPTIVNGDVTMLNDAGKMYWETQLLQKDMSVKTEQIEQLKSNTTQVNAQVHKLIADTYVNHGMFTGYTVSANGITGTSPIPTSYVTLSDMNRRVAAEQCKGYALNAYGTAASGSSGMIGTLIAAEIPNLDMTPYLTAWKTSIDKLNNAVLPSIAQSALSL